MNATPGQASLPLSPSTRRSPTTSGLRATFFSDTRRSLQTVLGLFWLLDGGLQFQSFMYSKGFVQMLTGMESGQPHWLSTTIGWGARLANTDLGVWNTLFALTQVAIGLGLLYRPTARLALAGSFAWVLVVWWFGEAFGGLFGNAANPLTGAPGGVLLYGLIALLAWPNGRAGGLLGVRGARIMWAALWTVMAWAWLLPGSSSGNATYSALEGASSGIGWVDSVIHHAGNLTKGNGLVIAVVLALVSLAIGIAVGVDWHAETFLLLAVYLNVLYWIFGQGLGALATGSATDPNSGPLFVVLAFGVYATLRAAPARSAP